MDETIGINTKGLEASMQGTGLDLVYYWNIFSNPNELLCCDNFGCFETIIDNIKSIVIVRTEMVPNDPYGNNERLDDYIKYIEDRFIQMQDDVDIYYMGVQLTQTRVSEDEKGIYKIGGKYRGANSPIELKKRCEKYEYGYSIDAPYKMSEIADEYYFVEHLYYNFGKVLSFERECSVCKDCESNLFDRWIIFVIKNNKIYKYKIYFNPYALEKFNHPINNSQDLYGFTFREGEN